MTTVAPAPVLDIFVPGRPAPQGNITKNKYGAVYDKTKGLSTWRDDVRQGCLAVWGGLAPLDGPLELHVEFVRPRPASAPKRRTPHATTQPDLDKLVRAVGDAISSAGIWVDDARVVRCVSAKRVAEIGEAPGARIRIYRLTDGEGP